MADEEKPGRIALDDEVEELIRKRVKLEVQDVVEAAVAKDGEKRYRQLKWLVGVVALIGLGTYGTLAGFLIRDAVVQQLESRTGNISEALAFVRFSSIAVPLGLEKHFSPEDMDAVMGYLRRVPKNERKTSEFRAALVRVVGTFARANQDAAIDEILFLFEREILTTDSLVGILIHHYGQLIVARAVDPKDDKTLANFEKLERVASGAGVPELPMVYRVLYRHRKNPGHTLPSVVRLINHAAMLNEENCAEFFGQILLRTKAENWQSESSEQSRAFEGITRGFLGTYRNAILNKFPIDKEYQKILQEAARDGVNDDEAKKLARMMAEARGSP